MKRNFDTAKRNREHIDCKDNWLISWLTDCLDRYVAVERRSDVGGLAAASQLYPERIGK
jgi:hypothetical protein